MNIRSLAFKTDLAFLAANGHVEDRGDYWFCETPDNPGFFWGNLLLMKSPPQAGDLETWTALFSAEFAHRPLVKHMTFGWDSPEGIEGEIAPFRAAGFDLERSVILTLRANEFTRPNRVSLEVEVRELATPDNWEAAVLNQVACRRADFREEMYLPFKRIQMAQYRELARKGNGAWFGAFVDGRLVADCGLFVFGDVGRYQAVGTHPEFRKRGICSRLILETARLAFEKNGARVLVMAADPDYHAARIYESVGFRRTEKQIGAYIWPKSDWT